MASIDCHHKNETGFLCLELTEFFERSLLTQHLTALSGLNLFVNTVAKRSTRSSRFNGHILHCNLHEIQVSQSLRTYAHIKLYYYHALSRAQTYCPI